MKILDFIFYYFGKVLIKILMSIFYRLEVRNNQVLPQKTAALLVGNHSSWFDTLILSLATNRRIWFVTGDFILNVPIMKNIVEHLYILPMRRTKGKEGISLAVKKLGDGKLVCIFPEGEITPTGKMIRFRNGASVIQKETNVPVIPFYIDGASEAWSIVQPKLKLFKKMSITFGEPFYPQSEKESDMAKEFQACVEALKPVED